MRLEIKLNILKSNVLEAQFCSSLIALVSKLI